MVLGPLVLPVHLVVLTISLGSGVFFFMLTSPFSKTRTRHVLSEMIGLFVWLVVFVWIGKVLLKWRLFFEDPVSILIYPSNHQALYIGIVFTVLYSLWAYRDREKLQGIGLSALVMLNYASFVYFFISVIWMPVRDVYLGEMALGVVLVIWQVVVINRDSATSGWAGIAGALSVGKLILALQFGETFFFHYKVDLWFWIFIGMLFIPLFYKKKVRI